MSKSKIFFRASEFKEQIVEAKKIAFERGMSLGFHTGHESISFKKGFSTTVYSFPHVGKSVLLFDILVNQARSYDRKIAIYSPETGDKQTVVATLIQNFLGKKLYGTNRQVVSLDEYLEAIDFIDNHFIIIEPDLVDKTKKFTFREAFNTVHLANAEYGWNIDILLLDPFNFMQKDEAENRMPTQDYVLNSIMFINEASKKLNLHSIVVTHLRDAERVVDKDTGIEFYPKPFPNELANGQSWWRASMQMIGLWRCPEGVIDKTNGCPYPANALELYVQKSKPFGAGRLSSFRIFFDDNRQKFYEHIDGRNYYINEYEDLYNNQNPKQLNLQPSNYWNEAQEEKAPF